VIFFSIFSNFKHADLDFEATVAKACASLNDKGFVNYYGLQRFGTSSIATHEIGVEILKENYAGAVDLLLRPREESARNSFLTETRKIWAETKNANAALDKLPRKYCNEGRVLFGLKDNPNDYVGALGRLARPMRQMYVHAVQSFIWNRLASFRLSLGGDILVGDLVQPNEREKLKVERVDEENIKNHSIEDVVISMPGLQISIIPYFINSRVRCMLQSAFGRFHGQRARITWSHERFFQRKCERLSITWRLS